MFVKKDYTKYFYYGGAEKEWKRTLGRGTEVASIDADSMVLRQASNSSVCGCMCSCLTMCVSETVKNK